LVAHYTRAEKVLKHLNGPNQSQLKVLTMADSDAIRIKGTIALAGGRAFFVPAGYTKRG